MKTPGATKWALHKTLKTNTVGAWGYTYKPKQRGTYQFYAAYGTLKSSTVKVSVR